LGELIPIVLFLVLGAVGMSYSPLGRALARRIGGEKATAEETPTLAEFEELREELGSVRHQLGEVQERVDFAERLLAQARAKGQLGEGGS
jgi:hypothetical protein